MLDKKFRLRKQKDFEKMFTGGIYLSCDFLALKAIKNDLSISRFGFIVSNKVSKSAIVRNKMKRRLRESVRRIQEKVREGFDCLFISKQGIAEKESAEIKVAVEKLLKRSGILNK
ncbi:MAG: ribonuclease P protein component [Minisyncoccia bacterium]